MQYLESISEERGLALLTDDDLDILSLGISMVGHTEIKMAQQNPKRGIIATTLDERGIEVTNKLIKEAGLESQITTKLEDVTKLMPYEDNSFDFVYSRLCLHYIDDNGMKHALSEMRRVLRSGERAFLVLQSDKRREGKKLNEKFIPETGMTQYLSTIHKEIRQRRFYSQEDFIKVNKESGLQIISMSEYKELLCTNYDRTTRSPEPDGLLEVVLKKTI